ncbi:MAG TPA: SpoIIE family protein phosphatase [Bacteroidia bacterium]|nr:SpoIIE family protein phosphatase [Bacteroidia bacterium]
MLLLVFVPFRGVSQEPDTNKINEVFAKIWPMHYRNMDSAMMLSGYCYQQALQTKNKLFILRTQHMVGVLDQEAGNYNGSILFLDSAITLAQELKDEKRLGHLYNSIGMSYYLAGNYSKGMEYVIMSAKLKEKIGDVPGTITTYLNISALYEEQNDTANARKYAQQAYDVCGRSGTADLLPEVNDAMGKALLSCGDTVRGKAYLLKALDEAKKTNTPLKSVTTLENLSTLALSRGDTAEARKYILAFEDACGRTQDKMHLTGLYAAYAKYFWLKKNYHMSEKYSRIAIGLAGKEKPEVQAAMYDVYAKALVAQNKTVEAISALERLSALKDSASEISMKMAARRISEEYESQKNANEIRHLNETQKQNEAELERKNELIAVVVPGLVLISVFAFLLFRVYRRDKRNINLLQLKNKEIEIKNNIISSRNKDISDSISYARRIQDALLGDLKTKDVLFGEASSFVLYKPKDILSGDFYWFGEKDGRKIVAAADCTGHGIPGALLSIACSSFLDDIISHKGVTDPAEILSELRYTVIKALKQTGAQGETKDGMDIALISIDEKNRMVNFAGANNSLCIVRKNNGEKTIEKIDGDRRTVGYHLGRGLPFTGHSFSYGTGDFLYLFTDGYCDQFGGTENKKFRKKSLMDILLSIADLPMDRQEEALLKAHLEWKGEEEQTDDMLVIGVRMN